ncbi:MAG: hypothetical protein IJ779_07335 [Ruminococcus sp.]|nr:hypothetical protein [Ruminococcus sp.]
MSDQKKRILPKILLTLLILIAALVCFIFFNGSKNMKAMNQTLDSGMETISKYAKVTPVDPGEYKEIKMYGLMKFDVSQYDISDLGNLSVMKVNMGFMQMVSYVITPYKKGMPLLSMDFMYIMGNRKAYAEFYDLVPDTSTEEYKQVIDKIREFEGRFSDLDDLQTEPAWYDELMTVVLHKQTKSANDSRVEEMFCDAIRTYMEAAEGLEELSDEEKAEKLEITQKYCNDLVEKGGVSTDVFKKQLGEEKTKDFFDKVFFGTERYR